ncbi:MAG TPA: glycosyltransferase family 1 protein [Thermoanaerobaculia bacterium]|nr:glycosyltransferase family 1 protein [Thermoanaerobaculia bacterium]
MNLVHIVPTLPPPEEGVGTYALALARALARGHGISSGFVVGNPDWPGRGEAEGFPVSRLPARSAAELVSSLTRAGTATVLVHYVNYGYQRRGCPYWLVDGLTRWRRERPRHRLVTVFHEVYATGLPWQSSFWLQPVQRRLARALLRRSHGAVTSLDLYVERLGGETAMGGIAVSPVFSTVGEPRTVPPLADRAPRLVVFGGRGVRLRTWTGRLAELEAACRALGIEEICDVGPAVDSPATVAGVPVLRYGIRSVPEVSELLGGSRAGFLAYPPDFLAKSTIFAAYCAHGLVPVCAWTPPLPARETALERLFWRPGTSETPENIARAARTWYEGHSLNRQTETFRRLVSP